MHTIIKIAVVSVLALFAIVGMVSISKAEETVLYCVSTNFLEIDSDHKMVIKDTIIFKIKVTPKQAVIKGDIFEWLDLGFYKGPDHWGSPKQIMVLAEFDEGNFRYCITPAISSGKHKYIYL